MIEAGASVSDDPPATMQELPAPGGGEYLMCRLEPGVTPRGWDEWAQWVVVDSGGLPVGYIAESHELVAHNTWGPATYTAAHNPAGHDGPPLWQQADFTSPDEAYAALLAVLRGGPSNG